MTDSAANRFDKIDTRLETLSNALGEFRTQFDTNTAAITTFLERLTSELLDIARLHQQALRVSQQNAEQDRAEIRRIWEYLLGQQQNGHGGRGGD